MPACTVTSLAALLNGQACRPTPPGFDTLIYALPVSDFVASGNAYAAGDYIIETLTIGVSAKWLPIYARSQSVNYTETYRVEDGSVEGVLTFNLSPYANIGATLEERRARSKYLHDVLVQDDQGWIFVVKERGGVRLLLGVSLDRTTPMRRNEGNLDNLGTADADIAVKTFVFRGILGQSAPILDPSVVLDVQT